MTIIAALDAGDYLCLAADSKVTDSSGVEFTRQKLHVVPGKPLAWGFSGDEGIGYEFRDWLHAWAWPAGATWRVIADAAIEELSRLNGRRRDLSKLAGVETSAEEVTQVLMVGYVAGSPDIFELSDRGAATSLKRETIVAIGSGKPHALIAYEAIRAVKPEFEPDGRLLAVVVQLAARLAPQCELPVRILRIDSTGIAEIVARGVND